MVFSTSITGPPSQSRRAMRSPSNLALDVRFEGLGEGNVQGSHVQAPSPINPAVHVNNCQRPGSRQLSAISSQTEESLFSVFAEG
jgi:hypothetical protein